MTVVELHPEELIDKLALGGPGLTSAERERLDAHVAQCSACRLELGVRADLEQEVPEIKQRPQLTFPSQQLRARAAATRMQVAVRPRSRPRRLLVLLVAALVLCAGGAAAAVVTGAVRVPWLRRAPDSSRAVAVTSSSPALGAKAKRVAQRPALAPEALPPAEPEILAAPLPATSASALPSSRPVATLGALAPALPSLTRPDQARPRSAGLLAPVPASAPTATEAQHLQTPSAALPVEPAAALFADANRARRDGNLDRAVSLYRSLQSRYPRSSESELSRALLARLLLDRGNPEAALAGFDRYLAQGSAALGAEALVGRARALEQLGRTAQAIAAWREVQSRFAGSVHARFAATRLAALGTR